MLNYKKVLIAITLCIPLFAQKPYTNQLVYPPESINEIKFDQAASELMSKYDILKYSLDLSVSNSSTFISGSNEISAVVTSAPLDTFCVDLIKTVVTNKTYMVIDSFFINSQKCNYVHSSSDDRVRAALPTPLPVNSYFKAKIFYHGSGARCDLTYWVGMYTTKAFGDSVCSINSEPFYSKMWFPCKQVLTDKADSVKIVLTTEEGNKTGANGLLTSVEHLSGNKVRYVWESNYPTAFYLVSYAVGPYLEHRTYYHPSASSDSMLIMSNLLRNCPYNDRSIYAIEKTKELISCYEQFFGQYPFINEKYGYNVYCQERSGNMENQTMTAISAPGLDTTYDSFLAMAHELAHSWFGNKVTCKTWQDIWINEGFGTYLEYFAVKTLQPTWRAQEWLKTIHNLALRYTNGSVFVPANSLYFLRIFDGSLSYAKGAAILHLIRYVINDDSLFINIMKEFIQSHAYGTASGEDFKDLINLRTGLNFDDFFNQWYYGEGYPNYELSWWQDQGILYIRSRQYSSSTITTLFTTPVEFRINYTGGDTLVRFNQTTNLDTFKLYIPQTVTSLEFDPDDWLIKKSTFLTSVDDNQNYNSDVKFTLNQNYPNPFNPSTIISYEISKMTSVSLKVYDLLGREVVLLVNEEQSSGFHQLEYNAAGLANGVYFYRLTAGEFNATKKFIILK